jgi:hypothetical protein
LAELYRVLQVEKANAAKRKATAADQSTPVSHAKRQRGADIKFSTTATAPSGLTTAHASSLLSEAPASKKPIAKGSTAEDQSRESLLSGRGNEDSIAEANPIADGRGDNPSSTSKDASSSAKQIVDAAAPAPSSPDPFFYLLKPSTTGTAKVLIPMDASQTLTESLSTRVVLEFPTIYILHRSPDELTSSKSENKEQYITEEIYLASQRAREAKEVAKVSSNQSSSKGGAPGAGRDVLDSRSSAEANAHRSATGANATMPMSAEQRASKNAASQVDDAQRARQEAAAKDPNKILEMLRRDLSGMM